MHAENARKNPPGYHFGVFLGPARSRPQGEAARDQRKQHEKSVRKFGNNVRSAANDNAGEKLRKHIAGNAAATMQEESQARNTIESEIRNEITDTQGKTSTHNL